MKQLRTNAIYNVLGWLLPTLVFVVLTPIMVRSLGVEGFGIISLVQIITGYMNVLNFGFSEAITKQVAESYERDRGRAVQVAWVGFWLFFGFGLLGAIGLFFGAHWLAYDLLKVSEPLRADTAEAIRIGAAVFLLQMVAEFYRGTAIGCQRFDIPNLTRILRITLSGVFIVVALHMGLGLAGTMWGTLGGLVIGLVVNIVWMQGVLPLRHAGGDLKPIYQEVFRYSKHIFTVRIAGLVASRLGQFYLGTLSSAASVALYEVPVRVAETGSVFLNRILQVLFPGFAAMDRVTEIERIRRVFLEATSLQLLVITPFFVGMVLEGYTLLALWIDPKFAQGAAGILLFVSVNYWLSSLTNLPTFLALSFNMPDIISKYSIIRMVIAIAAGYPLITHFGLAGAAAALLLSELPALFMIPETVRRTLGPQAVSELWRPMGLHFAIGAAIAVAYQWGLKPSALYTPWWVFAVPVCYLAAAAATGLLGPRERARIQSLVLKWK
jgi:O-antigen/teichoic acid export membrane protein